MHEERRHREGQHPEEPDGRERQAQRDAGHEGEQRPREHARTDRSRRPRCGAERLQGTGRGGGPSDRPVARLAAARGKLSSGTRPLPDSPIAGRDRPPRTMSDWWVAPPPSDSATRTSVRRHDLHGRTRRETCSSMRGCQPVADLRERENAQVRRGRPVTRSSPKISLLGVSAATRRGYWYQTSSADRVRERRRRRWPWWPAAARRASPRRRVRRRSRRRGRPRGR